MNIYVGNLPFTSTEDSVRELFAAYGQVESVSIIKDKVTGESRGFAFVQMPSNEEAQAAINGLNGQVMKGRTLTVNEARPRGEGGGGGGGGRGGFGGGGERRGGGGGGYGDRRGGGGGGGGYGDRRGGGGGGDRRGGSGGRGGDRSW